MKAPYIFLGICFLFSSIVNGSEHFDAAISQLETCFPVDIAKKKVMQKMLVKLISDRLEADSATTPDAIYEGAIYAIENLEQYGPSKEEFFHLKKSLSDVKDVELIHYDEFHEFLQRDKLSSSKNESLPIEHAVQNSFQVHILKCATSDEMNRYYSLDFSKSDVANTNKIIKSMGEHALYRLLLMKRELEKAGDRIEHVHPMRFIGHIFSHPKLANHMREVKRSRFKWSNFIGGFSRKMEAESKANNLIPYVAGFCEVTGANMQTVNHYILRKDWAGLVVHLIP